MNSAVAQPPTPGHPVDFDSLFRDLHWRELLDQSAEHQTAQLRQREEQDSERQFAQNAHNFIRLWNQFVTEYNQKKAFNVKLAKELSKAFRRLEKSSTWPELDKSN